MANSQSVKAGGRVQSPVWQFPKGIHTYEEVKALIKPLEIGQKVCVPYFSLPQYIFAVSVRQGLCWVAAGEFTEPIAVPINKVMPL